MRIHKFMRVVGPIAALAAAAGLAGCDGVNVTFNGEEGVPLSELDMSGDPPTAVVLGGPDAVVITAGDTFTIDVDGSNAAVDRMRFSLEDGSLAIGRAEDTQDASDRATVLVTMPAPSSLVIGGSGSITSDALAGDASVVVGGSGSVSVTGVDVESLDIAIGGSGSAELAGTAERLDVAIGGSGSADMPGLSVERAEVSIGGSGNASFASDGRVEANIGGSGTVRVSGSATCESNTFGSGRLICENASAAADEAVEEDA